MQILTIQEAKNQHLTYYYSGKPCKHGHISSRYVSTRQCTTCVSLASKEWSVANRSKRNAITRKWQKENPEKFKVSVDKYRVSNVDILRARSAEYKQKHRDDYTAWETHRKLAKQRATPKWLSTIQHKEIISIYKQAKKLSADTGVSYHVDHIVPLKGKTVCGLHVPWNLQIITQIENCKKNNVTWADMPT